MSAADVLNSGSIPATARNLMSTANTLPDSAARLEATLIKMNNTLDLNLVGGKQPPPPRPHVADSRT